MYRLVVNPGTPQERALELKNGTNLLGRGFANDFKFDDPSVSTSHCQIIVGDNAAVIRDLGSTNGTYVNDQPVQEAALQPGQSIRLGGLEMSLQSDAPPPLPAAVRMQPRLSVGSSRPPAAQGEEPPPPPAPVRIQPRLSIASSRPPVAAATEVEEPPPPPVPSGGAPPPPVAVAGAGRRCKFHPKNPARYLCNKCNRSFCELCVMARSTGGTIKKVCRTCGVECVPLQVRFERDVRRGFFSVLPGAFVYPFRGIGLLILILATILVGALDFVSIYRLWGILVTVIIYGFLFLFMQNIIHVTTSDENEPLCFPSADDLFGGAFQLGVTILASFGLPIALLIAKLLNVDVPVPAILCSIVLSILYFPMAFLAVAMKDSVMAANPLVVIPAILRIPVQYLVAAILLVGVFLVRRYGALLSSEAGSVTLTTREMSVLFMALGLKAALAFISMYLLTVSMRILGLLYNTNKEKLGWFTH